MGPGCTCWTVGQARPRSRHGTRPPRRTHCLFPWRRPPARAGRGPLLRVALERSLSPCPLDPRFTQRFCYSPAGPQQLFRRLRVARRQVRPVASPGACLRRRRCALGHNDCSLWLAPLLQSFSSFLFSPRGPRPSGGAALCVRAGCKTRALARVHFKLCPCPLPNRCQSCCRLSARRCPAG